MSAHKYRLGEIVSFVGRSILMNKAVGDYSIVRLMPSDDGYDEPQYRLKSTRESHERSAKESELRGLAAAHGAPA